MNKKTGVIAAIMIGVLLLCCGGVLFMTRSTFRQVKEALEADRAFAKEALVATGKSWDEAVFAKYASDAFNSEDKRKVTRKMFEVFNQKLGKLKSTEELKDIPGSLHADASGNKGKFFAGFRLAAQFEKGKGVFEVTIENIGKVKKISDIKLKSDQLFELSNVDLNKAKERLEKAATGTK